jgi:2-oxoisovalerate dehydrogenase E1 component
MFIDFLFEAAGQVALQAAKLRYMSNGQMSAPMVVRASAGTIKSAGPHHSGTYHPVWSHIPGLIVVMPSNPADAKGLMKTALRAYDPVIYLEPKSLFASKGEVPVGEYLVPFGQAKIVREGKQLTIVTCGQMVHRSLEAAKALEGDGVTCEVIDLRTLVPLDVDTIAASLAKTGRLLVVDEAYSMCGIGAEIGQAMMELAFEELDAPIGRLHMDPVSHPFNPKMEEAVTITAEKIVSAAKQVIAGHAPVARRVRGLAAQPAPAPAPVGRPETKVETKAAPAASVATAKGEPLIMPHGDLTVSEATVVKWHKAVGQAVKKGEVVLEVETEKAVSAIESPVTGTLAQILEPEGKVVKMGQQLAIISPR